MTNNILEIKNVNKGYPSFKLDNISFCSRLLFHFFSVPSNTDSDFLQAWIYKSKASHLLTYDLYSSRSYCFQWSNRHRKYSSCIGEVRRMVHE